MNILAGGGSKGALGMPQGSIFHLKAHPLLEMAGRIDFMFLGNPMLHLVPLRKILDPPLIASIILDAPSVSVGPSSRTSLIMIFYFCIRLRFSLYLRFESLESEGSFTMSKN